jgi:hypothetical protein
VAAAAQTDSSASRQAEGRPLRVHNFEVALYADRTVIANGNFRSSHIHPFSSRDFNM